MGLFIETGRDGALIIRGEIDLATAPEFEHAALGARHHGRLVLDLRDVTFIDSSGIRALVRISRGCAPATVVLREPSASAERLFRLVGLDEGRAWVVEREEATTAGSMVDDIEP